MILPQHEQMYPDKVMRHRLQEYVLQAGPPTFDASKATHATPQQVYEAVRRAQLAHGLTDIDPRYFVGTCFHESNGAVNEWDTEIATKSSPDGFVSVGAFQIGREEAKKFGFALEDMLDLGKAADCMVQLAQYNLSSILAAAAVASQRGKSNDLGAIVNGTVYPNGGVRAYLGITHNHGTGYMRATIATYGLDWARYRARNPFDNIVAHGYGEDCVTGGTWYAHVTEQKG